MLTRVADCNSMTRSPRVDLAFREVIHSRVSRRLRHADSTYSIPQRDLFQSLRSTLASPRDADSEHHLVASGLR